MRRHGIDDFAASFSPAALNATYPMLLRSAGYRTGFIGKWGVGAPPPSDRFDYFKGFAGQGDYFQEVGGVKRHLTALLAEQAVEFIDGSTPDAPFCLSVYFKAPHFPWTDHDPAFSHLYRDTSIPAASTVARSAAEGMPDFLRSSLGAPLGKRWIDDPKKRQEQIRLYYRLISGVDAAIGTILAELTKRKIADNTVILFLSDNGMLLGEHGLSGKWLMYEESIRIPLIIRDPRSPIEERGHPRDEMVLNIDIAPTILDLAGVAIPSGMQGRSLTPLVLGQSTPWRRDWFYEHLFTLPNRAPIPKSEGVRTERWKYIRYTEESPPYEELYDLMLDPLEEHNVSPLPENAEILGGLRARWKELREELR